MRTEDIWWKRLSNPVNLIENIADSILENKSVAVICRDGIPWKTSFLDAVMEDISQCSAGMRNSTHDIRENINPGDFLMKKYCSKQEQSRYVPSETKARFLSKSKFSTINKSRVFVFLDGQANEWVNFIDEYSSYFGEDDEHGLFVLLTSDGNIKSSEHIDCYDYDKMVSQFDTLLLCMTVLSEQNYGILEKQYISETAVSIADGNVMLAGKLAECGINLVIKPYETVDFVLSTDNFPMEMNEQKLKASVWKAQIKVLFPLLEQFRYDFISEHYREISDSLYGASNEDYKNKNVYDLEIIDLYHICKKRRIVSDTEFKCLGSFREARNILAHWELVPYKSVMDLFGRF